MNESQLANDIESLRTLKGYPWVLWVIGVLFLVGLAIDLLLLTSFARRRGATAAGTMPLIDSKPWGLAEVGLVTAVICTMLLIGSYAVAWMEKAGAIAGENLYLAQLLVSAIAMHGLGIFAILLLLHVARVSVREAFGIEWKGLGKALGRGLCFYLAVLPPVWVLLVVSESLCVRFKIPTPPQDMAQMFLTADSPAVRWGIVFMAVVAAPLFEELFFRGLAYPALKQKLGFFPAMMVTSVLFALIHLHAPTFLPLLALAVGLTLAYESTGNLAVPIVMHGLFNLMNIGQMWMVRS